MATITVRNLDDEVQMLLKQRAAANNRSMEAEARAILTETVRVDTFVTDWLAIADSVRADLELPRREVQRPIDLS
jgi:plasmid stability protein